MASRTDVFDLVSLASEIPGSLPVTLLGSRFPNEKSIATQVAQALRFLDNPDEIPAGRIAAMIIFLRVAAAKQPFVKLAAGTIDLREVVPDRFAVLLERVISEPKPDTLAAHETALLQVCAGIIQHISEPHGISVREGLWLTWRLFQWLCLQLDTLDPDARREGMRRLASRAPKVEQMKEPMDRLDPFGFGRDRFDIRLAAVLHAFGVMEEVWPVIPGTTLHKISSRQLEENLIALASRAPEGASSKSELEWNAPGTIPDLALLALLRLKLSGFGDLPEETRRRHIEALPVAPDRNRPEENRLPEAIVNSLLLTTMAGDQITSEERQLIIKKLRDMEDSKTSRHWRWIVFTGLFARGEAVLEYELFTLFVEHAASFRIKVLIGLYLLSLASLAVDRFATTVDKLVDAFVDRGASPIPIALGLGQVCQHGTGEGLESARGKLRTLAKTKPFCDDDDVQELVRFLGLVDDGADG